MRLLFSLLRRYWVLLSFFCTLILWLKNGYAFRPGAWGIEAKLSFATLVVATLVSLRRFWLAQGTKDLERSGSVFFALLLLSVHVMLQAYGLSNTSWYLLVPLTLSLAAVYANAVTTLLLLGLACTLEGWRSPSFISDTAAIVRCIFLFLFATLTYLTMRVERLRLTRIARSDRERERETAERDARMFRLVAAPTDNGRWDEQRLRQSSIGELRYSVFHTLELIKDALSLNTCALFMFDDVSGKLHLTEVVSDSDGVSPKLQGKAEGIVLAVAQRGETLRLENARAQHERLGYYQVPIAVRHFIGLPLVENNNVRGVLCADRLKDTPFTTQDEQVLRKVTTFLLRAAENERLFAQLERTKHQQSILFKASQSLGSALDENAVLDATFSALREITPHDFAAVTLYDAAQKRHRIRRACGEQADFFQGKSFRNQHSLVSMVVANRHYLPYRGDYDGAQQVAFDKSLPLRNMTSMLILPLTVADQVHGTLVLGSKQKRIFNQTLRTTLHVFANQAAVSLANAAAVQKLEELATIDGLTGCLNKRAFLDELDRRLRVAARFKRRLSLVVADIDHFKNVNDNFGHATGDTVLRSLGQIFRKVKRETDIVGRFGGEEFCLLCEETDTPGAEHLAERIRQELSSTAFQTGTGPLSVTCSAGLATFPRDAGDGQSLFALADKALYVAKRSGRNRVVSAGAI